jgi:hypothetical protein
VKGGILRLRHHRALSSKLSDFDFLYEVEPAIEIVERDGTTLEKQAISLLRDELEKAVSRRENLMIQQLVKEFTRLHWRVLSRQESFWRDQFGLLCEPRQPFVNSAEAEELINKGKLSFKRSDLRELREVVRALWKLLPRDEEELIEDQVRTVGITRYR